MLFLQLLALALCCPVLPTAATLLLAEDFSCASIGCNATSHGITNYTYWRHSTTGSKRSSLTVGPAGSGRAGNAVNFSVTYCAPPTPNPKHLGCYRSELALQHRIQGSLVDWETGIGSSVRWFGFSNRLLDFVWDTTSGHTLNGPSFQLHGAGELPQWKGKHPVLNLQVDSTGCAAGNRSCPVWTIGVSAGGKPDPACSEQYDACWKLGPALVNGTFGNWNDWVLKWRGSPLASRGSLAVWRNGVNVLPEVSGLATAYPDTVAPYLKFGVYHSEWKGEAVAPPNARHCAIAYGGLRVGDETSGKEEVSTAQ